MNALYKWRNTESILKKLAHSIIIMEMVKTHTLLKKKKAWKEIE